MAPGTAGQPAQNSGKKLNAKGGNTSKRKAAAAEEATQRRIGCPILLESGCRIGEPVDPNNPGDSVKLICQNPKCEYSPFVHRRCYEEWEDLLVTVMATTSWSRSWTDAQRRSNLWDKKGYQLIGKMCRCLCDKGHVRRDLDYKAPANEDVNAKKKVKKLSPAKNLPTLKNPDFKSGFIGKQLPNANGTSITSTTSTSATTPATSYVVSRNAAAKRQVFGYSPYGMGAPSPYSQSFDCHRSSSGTTTPATSAISSPEKTPVHANQLLDENGNAKRLGSFGEFLRLHNSTLKAEGFIVGDENENFDPVGEFENSIIPCVRSLLRWKNTPIQLTDSTLTEIVNSCSSETKKKISDEGGLGAALAKTGYFIVGADTLRLKENGTQLSDSLPPLLLDAGHGGDETATDLMSTLGQPKQESSSGFIPLNPPFGNKDHCATVNMLNHGTSPMLDVGQFSSIPVTSLPFCASTAADLMPAIREQAASRSSSSGFDEGSVGSLKSAHEIDCLCTEVPNSQYFVSNGTQCREAAESAYLQSEAPTEYYNRSLQFYNSAAPASARFIPSFPAGYVRQFWQPNPMQQIHPHMWYFREYQLFNGPSIEDLFRRDLPNLYSAAKFRFEPTKISNDLPVFSYI